MPPIALDPAWDRLAGPDPLGRGLVVEPGADVPEPWRKAPRLRFTDHDAPATLATARAERWRIVIEAGADELAPDHPVLRTDYWNLSPDTDLGHERLRHLALANSVDARDPARPVFAPVSDAVAAGAGLATDDGDVEIDGRDVWCDGGPLDLVTGVDLPVVPAVHLAAGTLRPLTDADPDAPLADDQLAAVTHRGGAARIIAPAGSGKTRVLTERARHLVRDLGVDPGSLCLVAFNVRARAEMQERTTDLPGIEIRTLNSLALAILSGRAPFARPAGRDTPRVIDERDVRRILADLVKGRRRAMSDPFAVWLEALGASRLGLRSPAAVEREFGGDVKGFADVLPAYRERLCAAGAVDFDEQILGAIEVLCTDPVARAAARRACGVLLVDEFQDLTPAHVLLVRLLAGPAAEVFGVGDDDQTIYGYSGASPEWLIDFDELFAGARHHDLHVNYRCPPEVVAAASTLLSHNRRRIPKEILAAPGRATASPDDPPPFDAVGDADPVGVTVAHVRALVDAGVRPRDIAVLTRVNATLLGPMLALGEAGIATTAPVDAAFLERTGIAAALAWLRLATAPEQRLSGTDVGIAARRPPRALRPMIVDWAGEQSSPTGLRQLAGRLRDERDTAKLLGFVDDLTAVRELVDAGATTAEVLTAVRDQVGLGAALDDRLDAARRSVDRSAHGDDLAALLAVARFETDPSRFGGWVADRLGARSVDEGDGVRLSTVHRVKGREWPHVVVHDVSAGLFPHRLAADREEERRVFHVAITRGSERVLVVAGEPPSPFLRELTRPRAPGDDPRPEHPRPGRPSRSPDPGPAPLSDDAADLRERLKAWRRSVAVGADIPAYVVFTDATLDALVAGRPMSEHELLDAPGIGPVKIERYGAAILAIVAGDDPG